MKKGMYDSGSSSNAGVKPALGRNPNSHSEVNGAPVGPGSHSMGYSGDSGMKGDATCKGKQGQTFNFK